jgi:hypothetical protein
MIYLNKILFPVKNCDWIFKIENFLSQDIYNNLSKEIIEESIFLEGDGKKSIDSNNDNFYKYSSKKIHLNSFLAEVKKKLFEII